MIHILSQKVGTPPRIIHTYPSTYSMKDAMKEFTETCRKNLSKKTTKARYVYSVQKYLDYLNSEHSISEYNDIDDIIESLTFVKELEFDGSGYYTNFGTIILHDDDKIDQLEFDGVLMFLQETKNK